MKKLISYVALPYVVCFLLGSCYSPRYVYSPAASNVPLLKQKGDSKLAGYYSVNPGEKNNATSAGKLNNGRGLDVQAAYAITNHLAVQGSYTKRIEKNYADFNLNSSDSSLISYNRYSVEFGVGYFTYIDKRRSSYFQVFGGAGIGKNTFTDKKFAGTIANHFTADISRIYLQPAIMIRYGEGFASSLSSRVSVVMFKNINSDYSIEELDKYQLKNITQGAKIFWEPAFINTIGFKKLPGLKFEFQIAIAFLMTQKFVDYRTFNLAGGLVLDVPKFFKRK